MLSQVNASDQGVAHVPAPERFAYPGPKGNGDSGLVGGLTLIHQSDGVWSGGDFALKLL